MTKSYIGMLALANARLAQVRLAASAEPSSSMTITYTSTWAFGKWYFECSRNKNALMLDVYTKQFKVKFFSPDKQLLTTILLTND